MVTEYQDIRKDMEADGCPLEDEQFSSLVEYARRKARVAGKDETYIPFLLPDVIREWFVRNAVNAFSMAVMEAEREYQM